MRHADRQPATSKPKNTAVRAITAMPTTDRSNRRIHSRMLPDVGKGLAGEVLLPVPLPVFWSQFTQPHGLGI